MEKKLSAIILSLFIFSISQASKYPQPSTRPILENQSYSYQRYAYNTQVPCSGGLAKMCLPANSKVDCSGYVYVSGNQGKTIQFCHMSGLHITGQGDLSIPASSNYFVATGVIDENGVYISNIPKNEIFSKQLNDTVAMPTVAPPTHETAKEKTEAEVPEPCETCGGKNLVTTVKDIVKDLTSSPTADTTPTALKKLVGDAFNNHSGKRGFSESCSNFIEDDGDIGSRGQKVIKAIHKVGFDCFDNKINVGSVCPNFKKFNDKKKEYFWVWVFASIAQEESTCGMKLTNPRATHGTAHGIVQMEDRKHRGIRDGKFCPHYEINNNDETFQFECASSILRDTTCKYGWPLSGSSGYWAELRGSNNAISVHIKKFPGCF